MWPARLARHTTFSKAHRLQLVLKTYTSFLVSYKYLFFESYDITSLAVKNIHQIIDLLSRVLITQLSFYRYFVKTKNSILPCIIHSIKLFDILVLESYGIFVLLNFKLLNLRNIFQHNVI